MQKKEGKKREKKVQMFIVWLMEVGGWEVGDQSIGAGPEAAAVPPAQAPLLHTHSREHWPASLLRLRRLARFRYATGFYHFVATSV